MMASAGLQHLPSVEKFAGLSHKKQRQHLQEALGRFLDRLQVEGREPDPHETQYFRSAMEALGEGNYDQAYEDAKALQNLPPVVEDDIGISGQPLSRSEMATGLRSLIDRLQQ
jgi:hypothetical protein